MSILSMFGAKEKEQDAAALAKLAAVDRVQAVIEFELDGTILNANENFLSVMGYALNEIVGQHHRIFVDPAEAASSGYAEFWRDLGRGQTKASEFKRVGKGGKEIW
ncbi:MAG: PAS domain S-box protein, partial [Geminicoccales bacterium]